MGVHPDSPTYKSLHNKRFSFIAKQLLCVVNCVACKACLTSRVMVPMNAFTYFKEYSDTEQSLTYPSEKLVETVGMSVTVLENMMADMAC
jgi:hypothetical protein